MACTARLRSCEHVYVGNPYINHRMLIQSLAINQTQAT